MHCTLCGTLLDSRADEYYFICTLCGGYVKDNRFYIDAALEKRHYEQHTNDPADAGYRKFTAPITNAILKRHSPGESGLDFGCGRGPVISLQLRENNFNVTLYDPFFHPGKEYLRQMYDFIFGCEVFEHLHHPRAEILALLNILKPGGWLYVMTHIYDHTIPFSKWYYRNDPTHVFIYTKQTMQYISSEFRLEMCVESERCMAFHKAR